MIGTALFTCPGDSFSKGTVDVTYIHKDKGYRIEYVEADSLVSIDCLKGRYTTSMTLHCNNKQKNITLFGILNTKMLRIGGLSNCQTFFLGCVGVKSSKGSRCYWGR